MRFFKPGDRLAEVELAEKFEVSRSPVREALLALEKEARSI
jgi:DNA-binding GntR family transcriptional regulator